MILSVTRFIGQPVRLLLAGTVIAVSGCTTIGPDFEKPEAPVADHWQQQKEEGLVAGPVELVEWWKVLNDPALDRPVAIKVIAPHLEGGSEAENLKARFLREARLAARLDHPGIVPVYELGLQPDRRPFFAMKLVKGKTLAAMLADREDPAADR